MLTISILTGTHVQKLITGKPDELVKPHINRYIEMVNKNSLENRFKDLSTNLKKMPIEQSKIDEVVNSIKENPQAAYEILTQNNIFVFNNNGLRYRIRGEQGKEESLKAIGELEAELVKIGVADAARRQNVIMKTLANPSEFPQILADEKIFYDGASLSKLSVADSLKVYIIMGDNPQLEINDTMTFVDLDKISKDKMVNSDATIRLMQLPANANQDTSPQSSAPNTSNTLSNHSKVSFVANIGQQQPVTDDINLTREQEILSLEPKFS